MTAILEHSEPAAATAAPAPAGPAILSVRGLEVAYGARPALKAVSCDIREREVTAILGPSGCGKSTFIRVLNRTLELIPGARVTGGSASFRGRDIFAPDRDPGALRREIGMLQQRPLPFPGSILANVLFGARFHRLLRGRSEREVAELHLRGAGLWDEVKDRLGEPATRLSLGQQQRLCLARALAGEPEVLLMDEPCSALDPASTERIEQLILRMRGQYTIVIVTHNIGQARRVSDRALFFRDGELLAAGESAAAFARPGHPWVAEYIAGHIG